MEQTKEVKNELSRPFCSVQAEAKGNFAEYGTLAFSPLNSKAGEKQEPLKQPERRKVNFGNM